MKCLNCNGALYGLTPIVKLVPLADRGGSIKIGGLQVGQIDATESWNEKDDAWEWIARALLDGPMQMPQHDEEGKKLIRGPIYCLDCGSEHYYVSKSKRPLRVGSYFRACERGHEALMGE